MIRYIRRLFGLCEHDYKQIMHRELKWAEDGCLAEDVFIIQCTKCKATKNYRVKY